MQEAAASGVYAPLFELLAAPARASVIRQLPYEVGSDRERSDQIPSRAPRLTSPRPPWSRPGAPVAASPRDLIEHRPVPVGASAAHAAGPSPPAPPDRLGRRIPEGMVGRW